MIHVPVCVWWCGRARGATTLGRTLLTMAGGRCRTVTGQLGEKERARVRGEGVGGSQELTCTPNWPVTLLQRWGSGLGFHGGCGGRLGENETKHEREGEEGRCGGDGVF